MPASNRSAAIDASQKAVRLSAATEPEKTAGYDKASDLVLEDKGLEVKRNQVRQRAYEIYLRRGQKDGLELEDWLRAEAEVAGIDRRDEAA